MKSVGGSISFVFILYNLNTFVQSIDDSSKWSLGNLKNRTSIDADVMQYYERKSFIMTICAYFEYSEPWQNYAMDFLSDALTKTKLMKYEIFINSNNQLPRLTKVSPQNLWYVDSYKAFLSLIDAVEYDNSEQYVIIMNTAEWLNRERETRLILEKSFEVNIVNIIVAVPIHHDGTFVLYSYEIFKQHHCRQVVVEQVNIFRNGHFQNDELFPQKFDNFNKCPLTMYIRNSSLFYRFNLTKDGKEIASIAGVEANMIKTMAAKLNFEFKMYYRKDENSVGNVYENGTVVGPFRNLNENKLDVLLGYYHYPIRSRHFEESTSYVFMPLVIVMNECKRNDFMEVWLFKPFRRETWIAFGILSVLVIVLVQLAHYYLNKTMTWLDIIGLIFGNSRPLHFKFFIAKISFLLCILSITILCATFEGRLYYAFNTKDLFKITTVQQLIEANYTFIITRRFDQAIIRSLHIPLTHIHYVDYYDDYFIYQEMLSYPKNSATFTNYWDFQMYIDSNKSYHEFDILPMVVILNQICAYMKNHSYLLKPINRIISALKFGGILNKWLQDQTNVARSSMKHKLPSKPLPLTISKFQIIFAGLIILYVLSILTFLIELIVRDWKKIVKK